MRASSIPMRENPDVILDILLFAAGDDIAVEADVIADSTHVPWISEMVCRLASELLPSVSVLAITVDGHVRNSSPQHCTCIHFGTMRMTEFSSNQSLELNVVFIRDKTLATGSPNITSGTYDASSPMTTLS